MSGYDFIGDEFWDDVDAGPEPVGDGEPLSGDERRAEATPSGVDYADPENVGVRVTDVHAAVQEQAAQPVQLPEGVWEAPDGSLWDEDAWQRHQAAVAGALEAEQAAEADQQRRLTLELQDHLGRLAPAQLAEFERWSDAHLQQQQTEATIREANRPLEDAVRSVGEQAAAAEAARAEEAAIRQAGAALLEAGVPEARLEEAWATADAAFQTMVGQGHQPSQELAEVVLRGVGEHYGLVARGVEPAYRTLTLSDGTEVVEAQHRPARFDAERFTSDYRDGSTAASRFFNRNGRRK